MMMYENVCNFAEEAEVCMPVPSGCLEFPDLKEAISSDPCQDRQWGEEVVNVVDIATPTLDINPTEDSSRSLLDDETCTHDSDRVNTVDPNLQEFDWGFDECHPDTVTKSLHTQASMSDKLVTTPADCVANEQTQRESSKRPRESNDGEQTSKKYKVPALSDADKNASDYVRMCRFFKSSDVESNLCFNENSIRIRLQRVFVTEAAGWEEKLNSADRAGFIESMCNAANAFVRLPFCLLRFIDYLKTQQGRDAWERREANFRLVFEDTICRVLANRGAQARSDKMIRRNQVFTQSLYDSYAWLSFFFQIEQDVSRNLCFLLMVVSCIEGHGVYHGRTSKGLSIPHKCCRFMIETLGGHVYPDDVEQCADSAERGLVETFLLSHL